MNIDLDKQLVCYLSLKENLLDKDDIEEFNRIYEKNTDLSYFVNLHLNKDLKKLKFFKWLPISTSAVERSFSVHKSILTDYRTNLKQETIFKMFLIMNK